MGGVIDFRQLLEGKNSTWTSAILHLIIISTGGAKGVGSMKRTIPLFLYNNANIVGSAIGVGKL